MKSADILPLIIVFLVTLSCATQRPENRCQYRTRHYIASVADIKGNTILFDIEGLRWAYSLRGLRNGAYGTPVPLTVRFIKDSVYRITKKELMKGDCKAELIVDITVR
jgi:hypothetical protein